ncbi:MAG TPA: glycosyltransferase family 4 protein [Candidatus Binatia bacterium]|nr:glycosyltransferase family 4 protein [Candidatus Binatia bacterium]
MKVLLVSRRWYPDVIGGGQLSAQLIAEALVQAGIEVRALTFTTDGKRRDETVNGVRITRLPIRTLKFFPRVSNLEWMYREMQLQTMNFLKEFRPDVIHALNGESVPSIAGVSRRTGIPFIAAVNGPSLVCFPGEGTDSQGKSCLGCRGKQRFHETMVRWGSQGKLVAFLYWLYSYPHMAYYARSLRAARLLVCPSEGVKRELVRIGYPSNDIRAIHNPLDLKVRKPTNLKRELGIPAKARVVLYAGRVTETKGVQNVIAALKDIPGAYYVIAGKGDYEPLLRKQAEELGIADRMRFVGFVPHDKLDSYYEIANVVIMAGTFYEFLGRMLMEASAYGVPAIGTNVGGIPDVIEDGKNGFLLQTQDIAELREKMQRILDSPALAKRMGAYGRQKIRKEFSFAAVAQQLIAAYRFVLNT